MNKTTRTLDRTDRAILRLLQENARLANVAVARRVGMAPSAVLERIRRLEKSGWICGYETRLNAAALGLGLVAFVFVRTREPVRASRIERQLAKLPEVQEVHHIAGEDCFLVKVRVRDTHALSRVLRQKFGNIPGVVATRTTIVLDTQKETGRLALDAAEQDDD
ncbi:MAG TPA: Lrp/AsnC family transcriptional regulator [Candidatus Nitrosotenuis sp.]|nr:Lrp/AsnC family transcriptional regulator [Candidatus Nitrosotenuis sp.]